MSLKSILVPAAMGVAAAYAHEFVDRSDDANKERAKYLADNPKAPTNSEPMALTAKRYGAAAAAAVIVGLLAKSFG